MLKKIRQNPISSKKSISSPWTTVRLKNCAQNKKKWCHFPYLSKLSVTNLSTHNGEQNNRPNLDNQQLRKFRENRWAIPPNNHQIK